ncbi:MAG: prephenate dehydratase domain-containing protein [Desulfocapsaceae bacterium]|jgi:prephenate dehydratase/prephenate dehydrogenase|nr:prephenate dehydratase domain-containing protein [Desulfocapsaceae bacterium]
MTTIATLGPEGSDCHHAALQYDPESELQFYHHISDVILHFSKNQADYALIPVYNTREGEVKEYFRLMEELAGGYWVDNVVLPIHLSLGAASADQSLNDVEVVVGRASVLKQCEEYISATMVQATLVSSGDLESAINRYMSSGGKNIVVIDTEDILHRFNLALLERELAPYNRTRFAVIGHQPHPQSGYDATSIITRPLPDRVGLLVDTLSEFTRRGINILDLRSENDIKTQKLKIYIEVEGHREDPLLSEALRIVETQVIGEENCIKILGSFPRVDMRVKKIRNIGFIGSGMMSSWFSEKLQSEGYKTIITGRSTKTRPADMISQVDVVVICVPISATTETVKTYGRLLRDGQALVLLAGESESPLNSAFDVTREGVELLFVHNLWGPQALTMKDKNVIVVRTRRSGSLCSEFESFLYKHGAEIYLDAPEKHDVLMGVCQKLPTIISVALAKTLKDKNIDYRDLGSHSTLTSLYGVLSMARVHNQNPRTYAEIMATSGEGKKIVAAFIENMELLFAIAERREIDRLCALIEENRAFMPDSFITSKMSQAQAVDAVLSDSGYRPG